MSTVTAKDLTKEFPRSPFDELDGVPWLPRLIDKVRALKAGKIGEYTPYPCGGDQNFLKTFGLDTEGLKKVIDSGATDQEISAWVKQHLPADWQTRAEGYRKGQRTGYPAGSEMAGYLQGAVTEFKAAHPNADVSKVDNFGRLICIEEGHPLP